MFHKSSTQFCEHYFIPSFQNSGSSNAWPYTSPGIFGRKGRLPESPKIVNATYFLSNRNCHECIIGWRKGDSTREFLKGKPVFITVHGWDSWADYWARPIKEEIFTFFKGDVNTIVVEWKYGADRTYPQVSYLK